MLVVAVVASPLVAQDQTTPKWDLFGGYQWTYPGGHVPDPANPSDQQGIQPPALGQGAGAALTRNFDSHLGLEGDIGHDRNAFGYESTFSVGPRFMFRTPGMNLFLHGLLGVNEFNIRTLDTTKTGVGAILGGGMDLPLWPRVTIRAFEADWVLAHQNFSDFAPPGSDAREPNLAGVRLRGGVLFNFGSLGPPVEPPTASCSLQPNEVMVGEPLTATATVSNFNPKHTLTYEWNGTGGKINGKENTASIDTNGVAGGSYTVTAHITDAKMKKGGVASCSATFVVKEPPKNPPTMSCSANPTDLQTGGSSTVSCTCTSPDNVPVTVGGWTASGGAISGSGNTGTLNTTGAPAGPITVSATCTDSRGLAASASSQVTVEVPPPPPPQASKLSECDFSKMDKIGKPWRVDNECKAILDDVAKNLQQNADNKLVIVGNAEPTEKRKNLAAERAVNAKAYLSGGEAKQAIDGSRIETRTGSAGTMTAEFWIVPAGATFSGEGTQLVDESMVKPVPDHPHVAPKKKMAKPKAQ
jgi:hypothetical protein